MKKVVSNLIVVALMIVFCSLTLSINVPKVKAEEDRTPPVIESFSIMPAEINTSDSAQTLTFEAVISDDLSGVCVYDDCDWDGTQVGSPPWLAIKALIGTQYTSFEITRVSGDDKSGTYTGTATIPRWSKVGIWEVGWFLVSDRLNNQKWYTPEELAALPDAKGVTIANTAESSNVTIEEEWEFSSNRTTVTFPVDTVVTRSEGGSFEFYRMVNQVVDIDNLPSTNIIGDPVLAIRLGIPGLNLNFSKNVTVSLNVGSGYEGMTLRIQSLEEGGEAWANETECTVSEEQCSFTVDHATYFVATNTEQSDEEKSETEGLTISPKILTTSGPGEPTRLQAYSKATTDGSNSLLEEDITDLFPESYLGGAGIIPIDQNNNGVLDQFLLFAINNGGPQALVRGLKEDSSLSSLGQMFVFDSSIRDGLSATSGDFDNDGFQDDAAFCLTGDRAPLVRVYTDVSGIDNWVKSAEFEAPFQDVGCNLGTFQYNDGADEILVTPNHGPADPYVYIYKADGSLLYNHFLAYETAINQGLTAVGAGERIYTTPNNGSSQVNAFDKEGERKNFWWVYEEQVRGDFTIRAAQLDPADEAQELLISPIGSNGPHILGYEPSGILRPTPNFFAFGDPTLRNGVGIAVIENWHGVN